MELSVGKVGGDERRRANGRDISMSGTFLRKHNNKSTTVNNLHMPQPRRSKDDSGQGGTK